MVLFGTNLLGHISIEELMKAQYSMLKLLFDPINVQLMHNLIWKLLFYCICFREKGVAMEKDTEYVWDHFQNSVQVCLNSLIIMYKKTTPFVLSSLFSLRERDIKAGETLSNRSYHFSLISFIAVFKSEFHILCTNN